MDRLERRAWGGAKLVAEQAAQFLVCTERLGDVAPCGEYLHEQPVSGLAIWGASDELTSGSLADVQLAASQAQRGGRVALECRAEDVVEAATMRIDPRGLLAGEQAATSHEERNQ
jgi:hypothetical protein